MGMGKKMKRIKKYKMTVIKIVMGHKVQHIANNPM